MLQLAAAHKGIDPSVQVAHLQSGKSLAAAERAQVLLDIGRKIPGEGGDEHLLIRLSPVFCQPLGAVHCQDSLASSRATQHPHGSATVSDGEFFLGGMQEDPPLREWRIQNRSH